MEEFLAIIGCIALLALFVWLHARNRKWKLSQLELTENEKVLMELDDIEAMQVGIPSPKVYPSCKLQLTNNRLIVAQKVLASDEYALRYVVSYADVAEVGLAEGKYQGYLDLAISPDSMEFDAQQNPMVLSIPILNVSLLQGQTIQIHGNGLDKVWTEMKQRKMPAT